jgi:DNA gyrase subunit A
MTTIFAKEIITIPIEEELKQSYLDYAMSVIVGRALPDVRDGLKPVHRRVLFAMHELHNDHDKPYKKSARIVGDVIGKYHPHGDAAVYETIVRMAQSFSLRYLLVDGQGNFGSVDGDAPAAMRYTEIRLSKIAHTLLNDLDKETVDFVPNYDGSEFMPFVLPTRIPNLLVNGSSGIAVGMATNIPPHNLVEIIDACIAVLHRPDISIDELIKIIPGPDFPTAGIISGKAGIIEAYRTGRGRIYIKARTSIETDDNTGRQAIIIHEIPYQVNKAKLQERIAELVKEKLVEGIAEIRDESDKDGMRVVIGLKRGENADVILNNLFIHTPMQVTFGFNMVALDNGQPKLLNLFQLIDAFLQHRRVVVTRRTIFELRKAKQRAHILEGLGIALVNIDEIVALIKQSKTPFEAKEGLLAKVWAAGIIKPMLERAGTDVSKPDELATKYGLHEDRYRLSESQAQAILDMRLHRLTGLEQDKINAEYQELLHTIVDLMEILAKPERLKQVINDELIEIKEQFGDKRRTEIINDRSEFTTEDLITPEDVVVTVSHEGYAKIQPLSDYAAQHRGGRGKIGTRVKEEDFVEHLIIANTHDTVLCFSDRGKVYWLKVYLLPHGERTSRGKPLVNLLPLTSDEKITAILPIREYVEHSNVFMATARGIVKKVKLSEFSNPRASGIIAVDLDEGDCLVGVGITNGNQNVMLFSDEGKAARFNEEKVRAMGRQARGVLGIRLEETQKVVSLIIEQPTGAILTATENGYGKRTIAEDYRQTNRGAHGVISIQVDERNGKVIGALQVQDNDEIMLISDRGILVRTRVSEISVIGRNTRGVKLINLSEGEKLIGLQCIAEIEKTDTVL